MPNPKYVFPIVHWKKKSILFTIGGNNGVNMKEVTQYSIETNSWKLHSQLPEAIHGSSAIVLKEIIFNIGGNASSHSILYCDLKGQADWSPAEIPNYSFKDQYYRMAHLIGNKIIYFGSFTSKSTFVLEK